MTGAHPSHAWSTSEDDRLAQMWNAGKSLPEIVDQMPRHPTEPAVKKRIGVLRKLGMDLVSRKKIAMPAAEAQKRRRAAVQAWRDREKLRPDPAPQTPAFQARGRLFIDDPRAVNDHGSSCLKIVPAASLTSSPLISTAAMAVR